MIKRLAYYIGLFAIFAFSFIPATQVNAQSCGPQNVTCPASCSSGCISVVTQPGRGTRSGVASALCSCQQPNAAGSRQEGQSCQKDADCVSSAPNCWGNVSAGLPTCHTTTASAANGGLGAGASGVNANATVCDSLPSDQQANCNKCSQKGPDYVWTAIGCIQTTPQAFVATILSIAIGIGGGIAFLLILFGGFQILTSAGNPEQLNAGQEIVSAAIAGLLLIIFSVFILRFIGYNIFGLPGFK